MSKFIMIFILIIVGVILFVVPHPFMILAAGFSTIACASFLLGLRKAKREALAFEAARFKRRSEEIADDGSEPCACYVNQDPDLATSCHRPHA